MVLTSCCRNSINSVILAQSVIKGAYALANSDHSSLSFVGPKVLDCILQQTI